MSALLDLMNLVDVDQDSFRATGHGPAGKRAFGGQFLGQSMAAAGRTIPAGLWPTSLHLQFLRGGDSGAAVEYAVERLYDGRTAMTRRVLARQDGRLITAATVSFAAPLPGPSHGERGGLPEDPATLERTGPAGPAPGLPLDELDIRITDSGVGTDFARRMYWRATVPVADDALPHTCLALFVTDVYLIDPVLRVHGHAMSDRSHRSGTTDASIWFHRPVHADAWNLLESRSPAAARGRGVVTAQLLSADGAVYATAVHEGMAVVRE
ncbi:acyl-CoA thioesterase [Mycolicibacterium tokaiense]|uniref:Acyl-CoA thioesterase n=1 Tax=Mycolicibacterium tokaiense TaxID=39695 RepID=A0A378TGX8_9MYCO|nr:acyl-CoA thioesterase domain-containing protein [Mycolicibacterium tokaiense]BBY85439.1 acyl-CoA thioesterase II [Mycolicibacterium tokaiense]STZ60051.1 acyl-CoA thioesterase [Mycolicibacterium tokaiense]